MKKILLISLLLASPLFAHPDDSMMAYFLGIFLILVLAGIGVIYGIVRLIKHLRKRK